MKPGGEVRLKGAYIVRYASHECDETGRVTRVHVTYDPETRGGQCERKVKGTLHWVGSMGAVPAEFRLYEPLLLDEQEDDARDFIERLNPDSLTVQYGFVEPALLAAQPGERFQFLRVGYFCADPDGASGMPAFNRTVALKDGFKG